MLEKLREAGMEINELTPEEKEAFIEKTLPVYNQFESELGKDLIDLAKKANE